VDNPRNFHPSKDEEQQKGDKLKKTKKAMLSPVAGPILHNGNLSPNLQARFCKLYPADFSVAIYLFVCSCLSGFDCVSFSSKIPPDFSKQCGARFRHRHQACGLFKLRPI